MSNNDDSHLAAERQYLSERTRELKKELDHGFRELSASLGVEVTSDSVTPEIMEQLAGAVTEMLRRLGNPSLSQQYEAAWSDFRIHNERLRALVEMLAAHPTLSDEDAAHLEAQSAATDEAAEQFERVQAQAGAWLDASDR